MAFGEIQRAIEQKFSVSRFGRLAQGGDEYDSHLPSRVLRSPKKVDRKPVYVLNLSVSPEQVDNFLEPAKSRDTSRVLSFVLEVIHRFLSRNGFASTPRRLTGIEAEPAEQPSRLHVPRKRVRREPFEPDLGDESLVPKTSRNTQEPIFLGNELRESCSDRQTGHDKICIHDDSGYFEWVDPSTGESFSIDSQTGNSLPKHRPLDQTQTGRSLANNDSSEVSSSFYLDRRWLSKDGSSALGASGSKTDVPTWLANALKVAASERILVLIDQHAADERVRVERYLKKICIGFIQDTVEVFQFDSPSKILLARREAEILTRPDSLNALSRWGLCVKIRVPGAPDGQNSIEEHDFCQAEVLSVPDVVSKRLIDRRELSDFVKAMATAIDVEGYSHWPLPSALGNEDGDWVKALRFCPLPLFELVNSRACRGAIMFNDPLDQHQCQRLITQLGETVFPFQCAHGRPSIAPLLRLDHIPPTTPINWQAFDERL
ncbi:DNA mismatch repair protein MLH3 [Rhizoctonia solani]|uniref:DNA mismatch repair protein MLH3 n=1 Tax=Rhizoctonia solani TaxID=456999 RepID=A0A0K6FTA4_9AGAM|nr:DNA mismatch repair protein MLH3 [Rhizoctonia solani]